jgi:hypothetical protein
MRLKYLKGGFLWVKETVAASAGKFTAGLTGNIVPKENTRTL